MRAACRIVSETHAMLAKAIRPGVTTRELNTLADAYIRGKGAKPSFLGYELTGESFPASICTSVNDEVIHGIPGLKRLKPGDIISIDIGAHFNNFHGDAARTHIVGDPEKTAPARKLVIDVAKGSFFEAMRYARHGRHLHELCAAIEAYITGNGCAVVDDFCGHGIGTLMHEEPQIPNHKQKNRGPRLQKGMTLAIEPMVVEGRSGNVRLLSDNWTVVTKNGRPAAHYENTVLITDGDPDILTLYD